MACTECLWRKRCSTSPSTACFHLHCARIREDAFWTDWKTVWKWKNNPFSLVPWFTVQLEEGRQLKGMCLWQWHWQHPASSNPAKSTGCWLYALVLQTVHLTPGFAHRTRNSTFLPLPQWTQGFLREVQCWGFIRGKGYTHRTEG